MIGILRKLYLFGKSCLIYFSLKIRYGNRIHMSLINSIKGLIKIIMFPKAQCSIGHFLMTEGALRLKCTEGAELVIGDRCFFNYNCSVTCVRQIIIGNGCNIANNVVIVDHDHVVDKEGVCAELSASPVVVGDRVWIGANAVITKGVQIGEGAVIAAGAVVTKDIPAHELWGGIPARKIKSIEQVG